LGAGEGSTEDFDAEGASAEGTVDFTVAVSALFNGDEGLLLSVFLELEFVSNAEFGGMESGGILLSYVIVKFYRFAERQDWAHPSVVQHGGTSAMLAKCSCMMRDDDHSRVLKAAFDGRTISFLEADVSHGQAFINQIHIKVYRKTQSKRKPSAHSRGVGANREIKIAAKLGKILHKAQDRPAIGTVNSANETQIFLTGQRTIESTEPHRPRDATIPIDTAVGRLLSAAKNPQERGFSRSIKAKNPDALVCIQYYIDIPQGAFALSAGSVEVSDFFELDHSLSRIFRTRGSKRSPRRRSTNPKTKR
jgi:hypothetical protein